MKKQESTFIAKVKDIVNSSPDFDEMVQQLASLSPPDTDQASVSTNALAEYIQDVEFDLDNESLDESESAIRKNIQQVISDIENGNWYRELFTAELAYSRLKDGAYSYKMMEERIEAPSIQDAQKQAASLKVTTPKPHPQATEFNLEDVRLRMKLVDSHGSPAPIQFSHHDLYPS